MTEIERIAKTLSAVTFDADETSVTLNGRTTIFEGSVEDTVRALLLALRNGPDDGSLRVWKSYTVRDLWQAQIDFMLEERP